MSVSVVPGGSCARAAIVFSGSKPIAAATTPSTEPEGPMIGCAMMTSGMPLTGLIWKSPTAVVPVAAAR